jgi:zinc-binding in reverse transcriptase
LRGNGQCSGGHCLITWKKVCLPKKHDDLGITDLHTLNHSLLIRWLWVLYTQPHSLWAVTISKCYTLPLTSQTCMISSFLRDMVQMIPLFKVSTETDADGQLQWRWEIQKGFTTASAYAFLSHTGITVDTQLWKANVPEKVRIFIWLIQHGWPHLGICVMCKSCIMETSEHLFLQCRAARVIWHPILPPTATSPYNY